MRSVLIFPLAVACTEPALEPPDLGVATSPLTCEEWGCGHNTGSVKIGSVFHDLDLGPFGMGGAANSEGLRITGVIGPQEQKPFALAVEDGDLDELVGKFGDQSFKGLDLVYTRLQLADASATYELELVATGRTEFWVGPEGVGGVTTYEFQVHANGHKFPLCEKSATEAQLALVFRGDRYDSVTKKVTDTPQGTWINITCAKTAPAKLHLLRHTRAGQLEPEYVTTVPERQAMLRMLVADYCGDGTVFTVDDQPLRYADSNDWYQHDHVVFPFDRPRLEALWSPDGAECIQRPRLHPLAEVQSHCRIPICPQDMTDWKQHGHVVSVNKVTLSPP